MSTHKKRYGWRPDLPDHRDHVLEAFRAAPLPKYVDLRPKCPAVYDQGQLGSCTGNAIAGAMAFALAKEGAIPSPFAPSRLFIYYNERALEGTIDQDAGAAIRDGIKVVHEQGAPSEATGPYKPSKFRARPTRQAFAEALGHQATSYARVTRSLAAFRSRPADGYPFVFGFSVYDSFESAVVAKSGELEMPAKSEQLLGGHAVLCVGYDDATSRFIVRNSWGPGWGQAGYFTMPYDYMLHAGLSSDFWSIQFVE